MFEFKGYFEVDNEKKRQIEASEVNLKNFIKVGSTSLLVHKSDRDLWKLSDDGKYIIKLVKDDEIVNENNLKKGD